MKIVTSLSLDHKFTVCSDLLMDCLSNDSRLASRVASAPIFMKGCDSSLPKSSYLSSRPIPLQNSSPSTSPLHSQPSTKASASPMAASPSLHHELHLESPPTSIWANSPHTIHSQLWEAVVETEMKRSNYRCEGCGRSDSSLSVHPRWEYDIGSLTASFVSFEVLCRQCHNCKHLKSLSPSERISAFQHYQSVKKVPIDKAKIIGSTVLKLCRDRESFQWKIDTSAFFATEVVQEWQKVRPYMDAGQFGYLCGHLSGSINP